MPDKPIAPDLKAKFADASKQLDKEGVSMAELWDGEDGPEKTAAKFDDFGTKKRFFEVNGQAVRMLKPNAIPEILVNGEWKPWPHMARLMFEAAPLEEAEFKKLVEGAAKPSE